MIEHIKNNKLLIITIVLLSLSNNFLKFPLLGTIWIAINANSLIGVQKLIESNFYNSDVFINILSYDYIIIFGRYIFSQCSQSFPSDDFSSYSSLNSNFI